MRLKKAQGNDLKINCEEGCVDVSSLYGGDVVVNTQAGNITMGDAHGKILKRSRYHQGGMSDIKGDRVGSKILHESLVGEVASFNFLWGGGGGV